MKLVREVNVGQLITLVSAIAMLISLYYTTQEKIAALSHASETRHGQQERQISENALNIKHTVELLEQMRLEMELNSEHRIRYDNHDR